MPNYNYCVTNYCILLYKKVVPLVVEVFAANDVVLEGCSWQ